jgi:hypothetical protein
MLNESDRIEYENAVSEQIDAMSRLPSAILTGTEFEKYLEILSGAKKTH